MDQTTDVEKLVHDLAQEDDSTRKMAAFKLQNLIPDPSFADVFISNGGVPTLRFLTLRATGNTLAYSLASLANLLNLDQGWDWINSELVYRLVTLVVSEPLVNISRGAMSILAAIISHPPDPESEEKFGFAALKPALDENPAFLETLARRLSSADHSLCYNALQLLNAILRDSMANDSASEEQSLFKKYTYLGVIEAVYMLMQDPAVQDLAHSLLDFQSLTKQLLRKWKEVDFNQEQQEHRRQLKSILQASKTQPSKTTGTRSDESSDTPSSPNSRKRDGEKWRRLGFQSEMPEQDFRDAGLLGVRDLKSFASKSEEVFPRLLQEQSTHTPEERCPIARVSISTTSILYDHFDIEDVNADESHQYVALESRSTLEKLFDPLLLQWSKLHNNLIQAFVRLWGTAGARQNDFAKIEYLVRILLEKVTDDELPGSRDITEVENRIATYELQRLREDQMALLGEMHKEAWGHHLRQVGSELHSEALAFVKEQRIRCLLQGSWFPILPAGSESAKSSSWRYVRLSHDRKCLHYDDYNSKTAEGQDPPSLDSLEYKIDLSLVTSVASNISPPSPSDERSSASLHTRTTATGFGESEKTSRSHTQIHIHGYPPSAASVQEPKGKKEAKHQRKASSRSATRVDSNAQEEQLLVLHPTSQALSSEWVDGLLFLLKQSPITAETNRLVDFVAGYGLKIRLLNVKFDYDLDEQGIPSDKHRDLKLPSRDGLDDDYYFDVAAF